MLTGPADPQKEIYDVVQAGDWIVWAEASPGMVKADWSIVARNLRTGEILPIEKGRLSATGRTEVTTLFGPYLAGSEDDLVWSTFEPGTDDTGVAVVRHYNLTTRSSEVIDRLEDISVGEFGHPRISGDYVVYDQGRIDVQNQGRYGVVKLYNLKTQERRTLDEGLNFHSPDIFGTQIVWMAGRHEIRLYDLQVGKIKALVSGGPERWLPRITERFVVWQQGADGVELVPLSAEERPTPVTITNGRGSSVAGRFLYWRTTDDTGNPVTGYVDLAAER